MLIKSARPVSREFYSREKTCLHWALLTWKNVSTLDLLHMVSWGCCNNTLLRKTCLHAIDPQPIAQSIKRLYFVLLGKW